MKRLFVLKLLLATGILFVSSCVIQRGLITDFNKKIIDPKQIDFKTGRVWVRSFAHTQIGSVASFNVTGTYGISASGIGVSRENIVAPSQEIISIIRNSGTFESVTPIEGSVPYNLILEGSVSAYWQTPWWTWVQFLDLAIHAWFLPTLGRDLICKVEINIYDKNYNPIYSASVNYKKKYISMIWWGISHGGAYDIGSDVASQKEVLEYTFAKIKDDLKIALKKYYELNEFSKNNGNSQFN